MKNSFRTPYALILILLLVFGCCNNDDPGPTPQLISVRAGSLDLNTGISTGNVPINSSIKFVVSTLIDPETATTSSLALAKGTTFVAFTISIFENIITLTPLSSLEFDTSYLLTISTALKSNKGVSLKSSSSFSFTTEPPPLLFVNMKSGTRDISIGERATNVSTTLPFTITFNTKVDPATTIGEAISLNLISGGTYTTIGIEVSVSDNAVTVAQINPLNHLAEYVLSTSGAIKSGKGVNLTNPISIYFITE
ncbi:MAG: Ig-like domain-containing protein [Bacteroidia bacterium]|nr:Ig-like domain-containing protein [Bacteroidia bacterium]